MSCIILISYLCIATFSLNGTIISSRELVSPQNHVVAILGDKHEYNTNKDALSRNALFNCFNTNYKNHTIIVEDPTKAFASCEGESSSLLCGLVDKINKKYPEKNCYSCDTDYAGITLNHMLSGRRPMQSLAALSNPDNNSQAIDWTWGNCTQEVVKTLSQTAAICKSLETTHPLRKTLITSYNATKKHLENLNQQLNQKNFNKDSRIGMIAIKGWLQSFFKDHTALQNEYNALAELPYDNPNWKQRWSILSHNIDKEYNQRSLQNSFESGSDWYTIQCLALTANRNCMELKATHDILKQAETTPCTVLVGERHAKALNTHLKAAGFLESHL